MKRIPYERTIRAGTTHEHDYIKSYVEDLEQIIDMDTIHSANLRIGADAMGGAGLVSSHLVSVPEQKRLEE